MSGAFLGGEWSSPVGGLVWAIRTIVAQVWPYWSPVAHPSLAHSKKWRQERKDAVLQVRVVRFDRTPPTSLLF